MNFLSGILGVALIVVPILMGYRTLRDDTARRRLRWNVPLVTLALAASAAFGGWISGDDLRVSGALAAVVLASLALAQAYRFSRLLVLDVAAVAFAVASAAERLLEFQHGTLLPEGLAGIVIAYVMWQEGRRSVQWQRPRGIVIGEYLVLGGLLRLVMATLLSRPPVFFPPSTPQFAAVLSTVGGATLLAIVVPRFLRTREEHRIIADVSKSGEAIQPEYAPASPECPHPELWKMYDSMSAEVEVLDFLKQLVITLKPNLVVETGTFLGISTLAIAEGLKQNGFGRVITVEYDPLVFAKAKERIECSGLSSWIECRNQSSLDLRVDGTIDLLFSDSDVNVRESEVRHFLPQISPTGMILMHDASSHQKVVREAALRLEAEGLISVVLLPTPRGLVLAQKRAGRK